MSKLFRNPITFVRNSSKEISKRVCVASASRGAGASFYCSQLALKEKGRVNIVELGESGYYLSYGMERRFAGEKLCYADDAVKSSKVEDSFCKMFGFNYLVRDPKIERSLKKEEIYRLIAFAPKGSTFFDFSGVENGIVLDLLSEMDEAYLVIDPMPGKLLKATSFIEKTRLISPNCTFVVNKMNKGVHRTELLRFLGTENVIEVPFYPIERLYSAEYNCSIPDFT